MDAEEFSVIQENCRMRNIETSYFETLEEAKLYILNIIPVDSTIGIGHSATLQKMGITQSLI
ncbi:hypothetical protein OXPF_02440 [Oxobacter pfennigii]|uniref:LUD domain-containing protein n=1 Tax=Oxobacter pfennigii TaxID=36849 RepID=A0A0P8WEH6_9CLOT|nr:hypothetical protein OXPF_02440 [Oxobacter pfennigii]